MNWVKVNEDLVRTFLREHFDGSPGARSKGFALRRVVEKCIRKLVDYKESCSNCGAPVNEVHMSCWACGSEFCREATVGDYLKEVKTNKLNLKGVRENSGLVAPNAPSGGTLRNLLEHVVGVFVDEGVQLPFYCSNCGVPVGYNHTECWACGESLEVESAVAIGVSELRDRAKLLGVEGYEDMDFLDLAECVELKELKKREQRSSRLNMTKEEAKYLRGRVAEILPKGWSINCNRQHVAYFDLDGVRRFAIFMRGIKVHFSVPDGFFGGIEDMEFLDREERVKRHYGRTNYTYEGEVSSRVLMYIEQVINVKKWV